MLSDKQQADNWQMLSDREKMLYQAGLRPTAPEIHMTQMEQMLASKGLRLKNTKTPPPGAWVVAITIAKRHLPYDAILGEYEWLKSLAVQKSRNLAELWNPLYWRTA